MLLKKDELADALREKMNGQSQIEFANFLKKNGLSVNQATISRLLNRHCKTATPKVKELCKHAGIPLDSYVRKEKPHESERLMKALGHVWDGSKAHADWLARVITTAGAAPN